MKFKLLTAAAFLIAAQTAMAEEKPFSCPSVETLKNIGINNITNDSDDWFGVVVSNKFGTNIDWTFIIGPIKSKYKNEILANANAALSSLTLVSGPRAIAGNPVQWACEYKSNDGSVQFAAAFTPTLSLDTAQFAKLKKI